MDEKSTLGVDIGIFSAIGENAEFLNRVQEACNQAGNNIAQRVRELGNIPADKAQGFFAEVWHAETFNADAVLNRMDRVRAEVLKSNGYKSIDVTVTDNGQTVGEYSLKYYKNAKASVDAQKGYGKQERLIPSDQVEGAQDYIKRQVHADRATGRPNRNVNADENEAMQDKVTGRVEHGESQSESLSRSEAEDRLRDARNRGVENPRPQIDTAKIAEESLRSGAVAAGITISMTVAPRIYNSIAYRCKQGEWPPETLKSIFQGTASIGAEAGIRAAVASSLTMSAKAGFFGEAMRSANPALIGTMTYLAFEAAKDFSKYAKGEMAGELLADSLMGKSVSASAGTYGAVLGTAIPVPIIGPMVGAMVGSIIAHHGYRFMDTVSEAYFRSEQFEEMKSINVALAKEWSDFINQYDEWAAKNHYYRTQRALLIEDGKALKKINAQFDSKIKEALEDGDE